MPHIYEIWNVEKCSFFTLSNPSRTVAECVWTLNKNVPVLYRANWLRQPFSRAYIRQITGCITFDDKALLVNQQRFLAFGSFDFEITDSMLQLTIFLKNDTLSDLVDIRFISREAWPSKLLFKRIARSLPLYAPMFFNCIDVTYQSYIIKIYWKYCVVYVSSRWHSIDWHRIDYRLHESLLRCLYRLRR